MKRGESGGGRDLDQLEVRVDPEACRAAGECVLRAPGSFEITQLGAAQLIESSGESAGAIIAAARSCPNFAISVRRDGRELA
jgi:ferredoxin